MDAERSDGQEIDRENDREIGDSTSQATGRTTWAETGQATWTAVDELVTERVVGEDEALSAVRAANATAGLPAIDVSAPQGKLLHLLARLVGASQVLEIGTLGGYSTIWLARAVPPDGRVVSLEVDPHHAEVAMANLATAGLGDRVEVRVGPALDTLVQLAHEGAVFDLVFIDADKVNNAGYVDAAVGMAHTGTVIVVDNVVRGGELLDGESTDPSVVGNRRLLDLAQADDRFDATVVQTVGSKGYDGFLLAVVR
jgi:predicted O-methyltransferase YrrM